MAGISPFLGLGGQGLHSADRMGVSSWGSPSASPRGPFPFSLRLSFHICKVGMRS